ncbi:hypothetical protein SCLCIDRAFT_1143280, partial [Scleroderma citrinum Foug A]
QVWFKVQVQQPSYHNPQSLEPPQSLLASPPSLWLPNGQYDFAIISQTDQSDWPSNGLRGHSVVQVCLIFLLLYSDIFLTYIQHLNATIPSLSNTNDGAVGMYVLKCAI